MREAFKQKLADALRSLAFRIDGVPTMTPEDVIENMNHNARVMVSRMHSIYMAQKAAHEMGFWTPENRDPREVN